MSSNIPIMKTGFDLCEPTTLNTHQKQMVSLITLFTENALRNACIYIKHSNRTQVTVEDVKRGLMLEVFLFTKRPDVIQKTNEITKILDEYSSDDEEDYVAEEEEEEEEFALSECTCGLCALYSNIHLKWEKWEPMTPIEKILYKHINNM